MKLIDYKLYPGVVLDVNDPQKVGKVKCMIPGMFDVLTDSRAFPWIYPFNMFGYQTFDKMRPGTHVWVLQNTINTSELWYIPMVDYIDITKELIDEHFDNDLQILLSRKTLEGSAQIYYNDKEGIVLKVNDTRLQISPDGKIIVGDGNHMLNLLGDSASLGSASEGLQPAVKGDDLVNTHSNASSALQKLSDACTGSETAALKMPLQELADIFKDTEKILAKHVKYN